MSRRTGAALIALAAAAAVAPLPRRLVERWYARGVYPALQRAMTPISNLVPVALFDILLVTAICVVVVRAVRAVRRDGWVRGTIDAAGFCAVAGAALYLAFLATWGLNYRRVPIADKVAYEPARITSVAAGSLGEANALTLNRLYASAHGAPESLDALGASFQATVRALGGRAPVALARPKPTMLAGYFHQISVSGMTDPFFLETLIASDLFEVERPFVIAHEWAHLAGYADESEANFVAWLTCRHGDAAAQYSAALAMLGYAPPDRPLRQALDVGPRIDLWAIQQRYASTNRTLRVAARRGYDTYLKANRVEKGIDSYDAVVQLILGVTPDAAGYPRLR